MTTALNLSGASDLTWSQRRAAAFLFSPLYCGYELRGSGEPHACCAYQVTDQYMSSTGGLLLGTALAISGAATSPNMGQRTSTVTAFLLTLANVRLGRWCPNPGRGHEGALDPPNDLYYFALELFGRAGKGTNFVYLSDGGHFENTGVYELVRRRCRLILAVDCGADPAYQFADLVRLIRQCRIDFGAEIDIGLDPLRPDVSSARSRQPVVVGEITYAGDKDGSPSAGVLILIKPTLIERLPNEILAYLGREKCFPQVATSDQWFDEAQFESYRTLGNWLARQALEIVEVRDALRTTLDFDMD